MFAVSIVSSVIEEGRCRHSTIDHTSALLVAVATVIAVGMQTAHSIHQLHHLATTVQRGYVVSFPVHVALCRHAQLDPCKVLLLGSHHTARSAQPTPCNTLLGCVPVMLHHVGGDVGPCAAQTCLAVDGDGTLLVLTNLKK